MALEIATHPPTVLGLRARANKQGKQKDAGKKRGGAAPGGRLALRPNAANNQESPMTPPPWHPDPMSDTPRLGDPRSITAILGPSP